MPDIFRAPPWAWLFASICGATILLTGDVLTAFQGLVSVGATLGCLIIAADTSKTTKTRLLLCLNITVVCWFVFLAVQLGKRALYS